MNDDIFGHEDFPMSFLFFVGCISFMEILTGLQYCSLFRVICPKHSAHRITCIYIYLIIHISHKC